MPTSIPAPKVLILGGGFAGVAASKVLFSSSWVKTTLVDERDAQLYYPSLYELAAEEVTKQTVLIPYSEIFGSQLNFIKTTVDKIDKENHQVYLQNGEIESYDFLVVALGAVNNDFGIPGVKEHAFMFRNCDETLAIRENIITAFKMSKERNKEEVSIAICGGGFSGIELAAELRHHLERVAKDYGNPKVTINIIEAGSQILPGMPQKVVSLTEQKLHDLKITVLLSSPVAAVTGKSVKLKTGQEISSDVVIWTAGTRPNPIISNMGLALDEKGRPVVNESLQSINYPEVFVIGDLSGYLNPKTGRPIPPQAYNAIAMGKLTGANILRLVTGLDLKEFEPEASDFIIPVGHDNAVALFGKNVVHGWYPALLRTFIEFRYLVSILGIFRALPAFFSEVKVLAE